MSKRRPVIHLMRAYDVTDESIGIRVLADRLWPRGIKSEQLRIDHWFKELTPSTRLRQWYHQHLDEWEEFEKRYLDELGSQGASVQKLLDIMRTGPLLLIFSSRDVEKNNAVVLRDYLLKASEKESSVVE